jgi:hypothetical protein
LIDIEQERHGNTAADHPPDELILQQLGAAVLLCWTQLSLTTQNTILDQTDDVIGLRPVPGIRDEILQLLSRRHNDPANS